MLVVYQGTYDEVLITTKDKEQELIDLYFTKGGRDLDTYDRYESNDFVEVLPRTTVRV